MERPGEQREMVFCHQCENEWYRAEHGLACPECQSEFTEIIEAGHDPRDAHLDDIDLEHEHDHDHEHTHTMPPFADLNPWADQSDQDRNDPDYYQWTRSGPGFHFSTTFHTSGPGQRQPNHGGPPATGAIPAFLQSLNRVLGTDQTGLHNRDGSPMPMGDGGGAGDERSRGGSPPFGNARVEVRPGGTRFTYSPSSRLQPRDANSPQPAINPFDPLNEFVPSPYLSPFHYHGSISNHNHRSPSLADGLPSLLGALLQHPAHDRAASPAPGGGAGPPPRGPMGIMNLPGLLEELLAFNLGGRHPHAFGDVAYSQEDMDRIISRLMEQTATSNAPGPASAAAIDALPKKPVDDAMLGDNGKAECSICMDDVVKGDLVTVLPCAHWFHQACVAAWLQEHDTCPHCRKGIEAPTTPPSPSARSGSSPHDRAPGIVPGAFPRDPWDGAHRRHRQSSHSHSHSHARMDVDGANGPDARVSGSRRTSGGSGRSHRSSHGSSGNGGSHASSPRGSTGESRSGVGGIRDRVSQFWRQR